MSKKKPLVEDQSAKPEETLELKLADGGSLTLEPVKSDTPVADSLEVEGSIFPQVPGEAKDESKAPDEGPDFDQELLKEIADVAAGSQEPTADELVSMVDQLLNDFKGQNKLDVIQRIEQIIKRQKSRM